MSEEDPKINRGGLSEALAISPDGRIIATDSSGGYITLWNSEGDKLGVMKPHRQDVHSLAFSRNGKYLASASSDGTICITLLDGPLDTPLYTLQTDFYRIADLQFLPDSERLIFRAERSSSVSYSSGAGLLMLWTVRDSQATELPLAIAI